MNKILLSLVFFYSCSQDIPIDLIDQNVISQCKDSYHTSIFRENKKYIECQEREGFFYNLFSSLNLKSTDCSYSLEYSDNLKNKCIAFFNSPMKYKIGEVLKPEDVGLLRYSNDCSVEVMGVFWSNGSDIDYPVLEALVLCGNQKVRELIKI